MRTERGLRAFSADLHRLVGSAALLFNVLLALTGVLILWPGVKAWLTSSGSGIESEPAPLVWRGSVDAALARARVAFPDLVVRSVVLPLAAGDALTVYGHTEDGVLQGTMGCHVELEPGTLAVRRVFDLRAASFRERFDAAVLPLHFGAWGGGGVRFLYVLLGLAPAVLALTGSYLAVGRIRTQRGSVKRRP